MASYLMLNAAILAFVIVAAIIGRRRLRRKPLLAALAVLLVMTAIFDNLIIVSGIVGYDSSRISGLYIGAAPIEDFAYALAAALLVPLLWQKQKAKQ